MSHCAITQDIIRISPEVNTANSQPVWHVPVCANDITYYRISARYTPSKHALTIMLRLTDVKQRNRIELCLALRAIPDSKYYKNNGKTCSLLRLYIHNSRVSVCNMGLRHNGFSELKLGHASIITSKRTCASLLPAGPKHLYTPCAPKIVHGPKPHAEAWRGTTFNHAPPTVPIDSPLSLLSAEAHSTASSPARFASSNALSLLSALVSSVRPLS